MKHTHSADAVSVRRRHIVAAGLVAPWVAAVPRWAHAVEPLTYLQAVAGVVTVVRGILGANDNDLEKQLGAINGKLDQLLAGQAVIISEIRALLPELREEFYRQWTEEYTRDINAIASAYAVYSRPPIDRSTRSPLGVIETDCLRATVKLGNARYLVFPTYAYGVAIDLLIRRLLRSSREQTSAAKRQFQAPIEAWLQPADPQSLPSALKALEAQIAERKAKLQARPMSFDANERWVREVGHHNESCEHRYVMRVTVGGSFDTGYEVASEGLIKTGQTRACVRPGPCLFVAPSAEFHRSSRCDMLAGEPAGSSEAEPHSRLKDFFQRRLSAIGIGSHSVHALVAAAPGALPTIPPYVETRYEVINEMNRERIAIMELALKAAYLDELKASMERFMALLQD